MGREYRFRVVGLAFALALGACGTTRTSATSTGAGGTTGVMPVSLVIGEAGGKVFASDGTSVEIPPGALTVSTTITLTPAPTAPAPAGAVWVGTPFDFGPEGTQFAKPITVTMSFTPSLVPKKKPEVLVATAPVGSTSYTSLGGTLNDPTHVSAPTTHFSIFGPAAEAPAGTTGGSTSGGTGTGGATGTGTGPGGATSTGTGTGSTTGAGTTTGSASGTTGGMPSCIGASGCAVVSVTNGPGDAGNGAGLCDYPFLSPVMVAASIANGNVVVPNQISFNFGSGIWTVGLTMTACPGPDGGQMPVQANVELNPTPGGQCSNSPYTAAGTIDFEPAVDAGLAGTFQVPLFGGMQGSFSFGQDPALCDLPAALDAGTPPEDAGATSCDSSNACLSDAGSLTGTGAFWLTDPGTFGASWCAGPLTDLSAVATLDNPAGSPQILVDFDQGLWTVEADLSCCPAGTGTLAATVSLYSTLCDPSTVGNVALSAAPGTVIFTETDGGLEGWITVDAGTLTSSASFTIPGP